MKPEDLKYFTFFDTIGGQRVLECMWEQVQRPVPNEELTQEVLMAREGWRRCLAMIEAITRIASRDERTESTDDRDLNYWPTDKFFGGPLTSHGRSE